MDGVMILTGLVEWDRRPWEFQVGCRVIIWCILYVYLDDGRFAVPDENGDDSDGEEDAAARDADGHDGQERVPPHVLHVQVEAAALVVVRPPARTAVGALELVLHVLPRIAPVAAPAASIPLFFLKKFRSN